MIVKNHPAVLTATLADGIVMLGLAASPVDELDDIDADVGDEAGYEYVAGGAGTPSVYWYTFEAYLKDNEPYPIKIGRGKNPLARISQQITAMPEPPKILGTYEHADEISLERALHAVLNLRGKRKKDAPGSEWFVTTPAEIETLIGTLLSG